MKKRKSAKPKTLAYIQDWGTYDNETMVTVGTTHTQVLAALGRFGVRPNIIESYSYVNEKHYTVNGFVWTHKHGTVLWLADWKYDADHLQTLVHETNHLIYDVTNKQNGQSEESEAQAYQQAYLFSAILKRLNQRFGGRK